MAEVRFQPDEHLPNSVADALRHRGIDALTAAEAGLLTRDHLSAISGIIILRKK